MIVYLNGQMVPESEARVSIFDRGFLYGDGLFETILVHKHKPFAWAAHMQRLALGAQQLRIAMPASDQVLRQIVSDLLQANALTDCLVRISISRGPGKRGYSPAGANTPTLAVSTHELRPDWTELRSVRLVTSSIRMSDPVGSTKHASKLANVIARAEADDQGADDALLLDEMGRVLECTAANVFWITKKSVHTPPHSPRVLAGITRGIVLKLCAGNGIQTSETRCTPEDLRSADGIFLTQTACGLMQVASLDARPLAASPLVARLHALLLNCILEGTE